MPLREWRSAASSNLKCMESSTSIAVHKLFMVIIYLTQEVSCQLNDLSANVTNVC